MLGPRVCWNAMLVKETPPRNGTDYPKELHDYKERCLKLEKKNEKAERRCFVLELQVGSLKKKNDELEEQITTIQKVVSKGENGKDGDKFVRLMVENKVLEYEKTKAENELNTWKEKVTELVSRVCELESKVNLKAVNESSGINDNDSVLMGKENVKEDEDGYASKKIAGSTPGVAQPCFSRDIDVNVEDAEFRKILEVEKLSDSSDLERNNPEDSDEDDKNVFGGHSIAKRKRASKVITSDDENGNSNEEDIDTISANQKRAFKIITSDDENGNNDEQSLDMDGCKVHTSVSLGVKRKRASKIITSDEENGDNDEECMDMNRFKGHSPITRSARRKMAIKIDTSDDDEVKEDVSKQHLTRLRKLKTKNKKYRNVFDLNKPISLHGHTSSEDDENEDGVENDSENEGESLGGFIVESSESACDSSSESSDNSLDESEGEASDGFEVTLDKIRRKRVSKLKWDLEGDMLADFGKDPELCMRAVCAIYRQQTADEKLLKGTLHVNDRGFSQCDATRGSKLAEFLTDGDFSGDLNKTVEELKQHDLKGIQLCTTLATKYSKQLFEIYQNKKDPYFLPS